MERCWSQMVLPPSREVEALINAWFDVQLGHDCDSQSPRSRWYLLFPLTRMRLVNGKETILAIVSPTTVIWGWRLPFLSKLTSHLEVQSCVWSWMISSMACSEKMYQGTSRLTHHILDSSRVCWPRRLGKAHQGSFVFSFPARYQCFCKQSKKTL